MVRFLRCRCRCRCRGGAAFGEHLVEVDDGGRLVHRVGDGHRGRGGAEGLEGRGQIVGLDLVYGQKPWPVRGTRPSQGVAPTSYEAGHLQHLGQVGVVIPAVELVLTTNDGGSHDSLDVSGHWVSSLTEGVTGGGSTGSPMCGFAVRGVSVFDDNRERNESVRSE
jgi:hypothetical protein